MKRTLKAFAALLGYPSQELKDHIGEVVEAIRYENALPHPALRRLQPLFDRIATEELLDLQSNYSELFDRSRSLSMHLFEHVHGDSRERGQAMIDLGHQYIESGFYLEASELPDFIPVFLEYTSALDPAEARETLAQPAHVIAALAERLDKRQSDYAAIFHGLVALAGARLDSAAIAGIDDNTPPVDPEVEDDWEETPVSFSAHAAHDMGGPTGPVARIRAANRAKAQEEAR